LQEENGKKVGVFQVRGTQCEGPAAETDEAADSLRVVSDYHFSVDAEHSLCAVGLQSGTRILFHSERP